MYVNPLLSKLSQIISDIYPRVSCQLSVVSCQLSVVSCQLSVVSCQLSLRNIKPQTTQTAYLLSQGGLHRPKLTRHDMLRFYDRFLECHLTATCQGLSFTTLKEVLQF